MISALYRILSIVTWTRTIQRGPRAVARRLARRELYGIVRRLVK